MATTADVHVRNPDSLPNTLRATNMLQKKIEELESQIASLELAYRQAGQGLAAQVAEDVKDIREAREEAARITSILQGTELFGRYAQDAEHHLEVANRWRSGAVAVLILTCLTATFLTINTDLGAVGLTAAISPAIILFFYTSIESNNHRRREFDRRRIALRVSAIESFTKQRREGGDPAGRKTAEDLLDEFVRKHFINPELDSNDITHLTPRASFTTVLDRKLRGADNET